MRELRLKVPVRSLRVEISDEQVKKLKHEATTAPGDRLISTSSPVQHHVQTIRLSRMLAALPRLHLILHLTRTMQISRGSVETIINDSEDVE